MSDKTKHVPSFSTEIEEKTFWESHVSAQYVDWGKAEKVMLPSLKLSSTAISLRLPIRLLEQIKLAANKRDVPYQSLIKIWLAEKVQT
jgi:predicted DNA binding CopG/RHH family protein